MHFLLHRDLRQNETVRCLLLGYLFCILIFLALLPFFEHTQTGFFPSDIAVQVLGSESLYIEARSITDLVTAVHSKLFLHSVIGLILASVVSRSALNPAFSRVAICFLFVLPVFEAFFLFAVLIWGPWLAYLKVASFAGLWLLQFTLAVYLIFYLFGKVR